MSLSPDTLTLLVAIIGTGLALAGLIMRGSTRHDADMREHRREMREFRRAMDAFRAEMQRLAERQAHVEGALSTAAAGQS